jgi:hypothetical protein
VLDTIFIGAALLAPNVLRRKVGNAVSYKHDLILGKLVFGMAILQSLAVFGPAYSVVESHL